MKYLPLIWAGVWRRPVRTALTMISVISAFVLFGVLQGFTSGLDSLVSAAQADLLVTQSQVSDIDPLPVAMTADIGRAPGVKLVAKVLYFGGQFRSPHEFMGGLAIVPDELRALDDQLKITPEQWAALKARRTGALISADRATQYGIKVGDRIPLTPNFWTNRDGTNVWPVDVVGIYPPVKDDPLAGGALVNYDYVDQARAKGAGTVEPAGRARRRPAPGQPDRRRHRPAVGQLRPPDPHLQRAAAGAGIGQLARPGRAGGADDRQRGVLRAAVLGRRGDDPVGPRAHRRVRHAEDAGLHRPGAVRADPDRDADPLRSGGQHRPGRLARSSTRWS